MVAKLYAVRYTLPAMASFIIGLILSALSLPLPAFAGAEHARVLEGAVQYLDQTQKKETAGIDYFNGEWPSTMMNAKPVPFIGDKGKSAYDSNSFTVSSIHNSLASIYSRQLWLVRIPAILDRSMARILSYRNGEGFNFWPLLEPYPPYPGSENKKVRRPNHFLFDSPRVAAGCNVYNDADDTAVAFLAMKLYVKLRPESKIELPARIGALFSRYRDVNRMIPHFYNLAKRTIHTKAFMTWLEDEHPWDVKSYLPSTERTYIPFGLNDVDCVVNANVLSALASYDELDTPGVKEACEFLDWTFRTGRQKSCGVYYPSPFNPHYVVAKAYDFGASCLRPALNRAIHEILKSQNSDGSWASDIEGDGVHNTLYALNTLLYAGHFDEYKSRGAIERATSYILSQKLDRADGAYAWQEGVFFSGGTIARHRIYWKSEPYTTALAADALSLYLARMAD
ncbi:MAG: hypothetical protein A2428_12930 [Bdellovibrionales bacterium RIFOXYC1_FULL_54_43]|nr:MAG: hypothetical protein A2428_12930 [Bdellovibrionales bacterium RIFOXYC1_FULL_54_43]OFZ80277.1 MAG: hypothetical protein A2603_03685 [Bdellovibrionales bacterium RIFOXYD1_FULL_55_31]